MLKEFSKFYQLSIEFRKLKEFSKYYELSIKF